MNSIFFSRKISICYKRIGYNINIMRQSACLVVNPITVKNFASLFNCLAHRGSTVGFLLLQCSSGGVRHPRDLQVSDSIHCFCQSPHLCSLFHHSIYLWFMCFPRWSIDELENLHADQTTNYMFWAITEAEDEVRSRKTGISTPPPCPAPYIPSILILTVPRRYFCCGYSCYLFLLSVLVHLLCELHILVQFR